MKGAIKNVAEVFPDPENVWEMLTLWPECSGRSPNFSLFFVLIKYI